jgi:hypothetical protein
MPVRSRLISTAAVLGVTALAACSDQATAPAAPAAQRTESVAAKPAGRYIVLFSSENSVPADFAARVASLGGKVKDVQKGAGFATVTGLNNAAAASLARVAGVSEVQADAVISLDEPATTRATLHESGINSQANPKSAIFYGWQWNMGLIGAEKAWAAGKLGSGTVTVGILDTGIDYDALDLNGLVDLSRSTSFIDSDDELATKFFPSRHKVTDFNGHGTNVATQVSSKAFAFAGVTSKTTLIGVKVLGANGSGPLSSVLSGVVWAADHGADVINMSLGGGFAKAGYGRFLGLINRTFNYAKSKGMTVVVSAGNASEDLDHNGNVFTTYCDAPHVICVSAVGPTTWAGNRNEPSFFTNYGAKSIDVAAPGGNAQIVDGEIVPSIWPWGEDIASWVWSLCAKNSLVTDKDDKVVFNPDGTPVLAGCQSGGVASGAVGTSQAAPHVTGLAALLVADGAKNKPGQIKKLIERSSLDLGPAGPDPFYGEGRIDVAKALGLQ